MNSFNPYSTEKEEQNRQILDQFNTLLCDSISGIEAIKKMDEELIKYFDSDNEMNFLIDQINHLNSLLKKLKISKERLDFEITYNSIFNDAVNFKQRLYDIFYKD